MSGGFEYPTLMSVEKTAEFLLAQISRVINAGKVCLRYGDTFIAYDQRENRFYRPSPGDICGEEWTCVILDDGELYLQASLSEQDVEAVKKHCSRSLANAREYDKVLKETLIDPLTGLLNKRALGDRLEEEIARCSRRGGSFCVLFLYIDNLKHINDGHGHLAGDDVLKDAAAAIRNSLRKSDVVARFGGDEFVVLLPDTSLQQGELVLERLLKGIKRVNIRGIPVSASAGLACYPEDGHDFERLIETADRRMYENKFSLRR